MILLYKKSIHKWTFWRSKSKLVYCLLSGLLYAAFTFIGTIAIKYISGASDGIIETSFQLSLGAFIASSFLSLANWYENERRYNEWLSETKE